MSRQTPPEAANSTHKNMSCHTPSQFHVDMGALTLLGVAPLQQDRTCVSGQTCTLEGITGTGLSTDTSFLALDTCGVSDNTGGFLLRFDAKAFLFGLLGG